MLTAVHKSDSGRVRSHNEDSTAVDLDHGIVIVADGMGGYRAGEVASALAVTAMVRALRRALNTAGSRATPLSGHLHAAIDAANNLIFDSAQREAAYSGMGTTVVSMLFDGANVSVANVGDSRAYRWRGGELQRLTVDHTVRQEMIDQGLFTEEQARAAVNGSLITRALGIDAQVHVDVQDWSVKPGDRFLLCSDGLTDMIEETAITKAFTDHEVDIETIADALVAQALHAGGEDNVSVVIIDAHPRKRYQDWLRSFISGRVHDNRTGSRT